MYRVYYDQQQPNQQQPSALRRWGHRALVGAGLMGGGVLGARFFYPRLVGGRALRKGESLAGKLVSRPVEPFTPLELLGTVLGKETAKLPAQARAFAKPGSLLRRGVEALERARLSPGRHFAVGMPGGKRIWEKGESMQGLSPKRELFKGAKRSQIRVHGEIPVATAADRAALRQRTLGLSTEGKRNDFSFLLNNCEHNARNVCGLKKQSTQVRGIARGLALGGAVGGGSTELITHPRQRS